MADDEDPSSLAGFVDEHKAAVWLATVLAPVLAVLVGVLLAPELVYDRFIWKHLVGPVQVDAMNQGGGCITRGGVTACSGYTLVSEAVYGITLVVLLYGIYTFLIRRFEIETKLGFLLALLPLVVLGPVGRSLEDAHVFFATGDPATSDPSILAYLFISPWIYFHIAFYAIAFLALGVLVERVARLHGFEETGEGRTMLWALVAVPLAFITSVYAFFATSFAPQLAVEAHPAWVLAAAVLGFVLYAWWLDRRGADLRVVTFAMGLPLVTPAVVLVARWFLLGPWTDDHRALQPEAAVAVLALTLAVVVLVYIVGRFLGDDAPRLRHYANPLNLLLVLAHMLDGFATYIAIEDPFGFGISGYGEKHPVSEFVLGFGDGLGFPIVKLVMVLVIIYLLDEGLEEPEGELTPEEREAEEDLVGLVKFAIFVLGFGPGLRNYLRLAMGV